MSFELWCNNGWLREQSIQPDVISRLMKSAWKNQNSAQIPGQDIEWQFKITYNAILSAATAALAAEGYRAARDSHHFRILESLGLTIRLNQDELDVLDNFRKKRNDSTYFGSEIISSVDATTIISMAADIVPRVEKHLLNKLPDIKLIRP